MKTEKLPAKMLLDGKTVVEPMSNAWEDIATGKWWVLLQGSTVARDRLTPIPEEEAK